MYIVHVELHIKPDRVDDFLDWKREEGIYQRQAAGFIKRRLYRETESPYIFYYVSFWESEDAMMTFVRDGFARARENVQARHGSASYVDKQIIRVVDEVFDEASELLAV